MKLKHPFFMAIFNFLSNLNHYKTPNIRIISVDFGRTMIFRLNSPAIQSRFYCVSTDCYELTYWKFLTRTAYIMWWKFKRIFSRGGTA